MPNLPTLSVSEEHYARLVAAFPGATTAEKEAAYRDWLTNRLIERVEMVEANIALQNVRASLPPRAPEPILPGVDPTV